MAKFEAKLDKNGDPVSASVEALSGRRLQIIEDEAKVHPFRSLAHKGHDFAVALRTFLEEMSKYEADTVGDVQAKVSLPRLFEEVCYCLSELLEIYETLPLVLSLRLKKDDISFFRTGIKHAVRDWNLLCNAIKHQSNTVTNLHYTYRPSGIVISGFRLCQPRAGAVLDVNKNFHRNGERMRSFVIALHEMVYALMRCDYLGAEAIRKSQEVECEPIQVHAFSFQTGDSLRKISERLVVALPKQSTMYDGFTISGSALELGRQQAAHINEDATGTEYYSGDGFTKVFPIG